MTLPRPWPGWSPSAPTRPSRTIRWIGFGYRPRPSFHPHLASPLKGEGHDLMVEGVGLLRPPLFPPPHLQKPSPSRGEGGVGVEMPPKPRSPSAPPKPPPPPASSPPQQ